MMTALSRRHVLAGAAATVAAAALPAVAVAEATPSGLLLAGNRELADAAACIGDWYWDVASRDVLEMTENGWRFLFNLADGARIPSDAEVGIEALDAALKAYDARRAEMRAMPINGGG
jgi:hypothetical protein